MRRIRSIHSISLKRAVQATPSRWRRKNARCEALGKLSAEHRAVLVMKDMEGMKYEEMAEILGVPVGTIRSRLHRARFEMRDVFLQEERCDEKKSPST
jgi:RNA polymerase sigma factor (sigma-70 family)